MMASGLDCCISSIAAYDFTDPNAAAETASGH